MASDGTCNKRAKSNIDSWSLAEPSPALKAYLENAQVQFSLDPGESERGDLIMKAWKAEGIGRASAERPLVGFI